MSNHILLFYHHIKPLLKIYLLWKTCTHINIYSYETCSISTMYKWGHARVELFMSDVWVE